MIIEGCTDAWPARLVSTLGEGEEGREEGGKGGRERGKRQSSMRERLGVEVCVCVCVCVRARARAKDQRPIAGQASLMVLCVYMCMRMYK